STTYIATAKIGFLLAIPPGNVTALWPPSGLALAAVLLRCGRVAGAVWVGSFLINLWFFFTAENAYGPLVAMSAGIATRSTAQALIGAWLVGRCFGGPIVPERGRAVYAFLGLVALTCVVGATCGAVSLYLGGAVARSEASQVWGTWWLGDCAGILVVAPT